MGDGQRAMKTVIIGGGIAGLVAAYDLSRNGVDVILLEREEQLGGMARSFDIEPGCSIDRYYHFICKPDRTYIRLLEELGLQSKLHWRVTEMGLFYDQRLHNIGHPSRLLRLPYLTFADKIRFCWTNAKTKFSPSQRWNHLENTPAREWLKRAYGKCAYEVLFKPLVDLKFRKYAEQLSAAWIWARFKRLCNSRTTTMRECIGYLDGGTETLVRSLGNALEKQGGQIRCASPIVQILIDNGHVTGVKCADETIPCDTVLSTIPTPRLLQILGNPMPKEFKPLEQLEYTDVEVAVLRLKQSLSPYFWLNINDPDTQLAGIIEYTNLNNLPELGGDTILYLPQYAATDSKFATMSDERILETYKGYLKKINPHFQDSWIKTWHVFRNRYAQPICCLGFSKLLPPIQTPIKGLAMTDSCQLHPNDRTIAGSAMLGHQAADEVMNSSSR